VLAFCIALTLNFVLPRLIPGNPVDVIVEGMTSGGSLSSEAARQVYAAYIAEFGLDKPR